MINAKKCISFFKKMNDFDRFLLIKKGGLKMKVLVLAPKEKKKSVDCGFDFDVTDEELNLYNCPHTSIKEKVKYSFERIN